MVERIPFEQFVKRVEIAIAETRVLIDEMAGDYRPAYDAAVDMLEALHTPRHMDDSELEQWLELCKECNLLVDEYHKKRWQKGAAA